MPDFIVWSSIHKIYHQEHTFTGWKQTHFMILNKWYYLNKNWGLFFWITAAETFTVEESIKIKYKFNRTRSYYNLSPKRRETYNQKKQLMNLYWHNIIIKPHLLTNRPPNILCTRLNWQQSDLVLVISIPICQKRNPQIALSTALFLSSRIWF